MKDNSNVVRSTDLETSFKIVAIEAIFFLSSHLISVKSHKSHAIIILKTIATWSTSLQNSQTELHGSIITCIFRRIKTQQ